ncbi:MAG: class I SAM-dependent methyltransferase [Candidatus Thorarchaeota archaeon]
MVEKIKEKLGEKFSRDADFLDLIIDDLKLDKKSKILDIGTGWGFMAITLALHDYEVITGEPEGAKWADWRSRAESVNVEDKITFKPFNAENLPFGDSSFNAVFLYTSLHHINNKSRAISEILRVLKYDGYLIIIELTEEGVEKIRRRHISHPNAIDPREFTKKFDLEARTMQNKFLNAYIYKKRS